MRCEVRTPWTATYTDPITLRAGEALALDGREDIWDGHRWLWARNGAGKEGWIPDSLARRDGAGWVAERDYTAMELSCTAGDVLEVIEARHGWHFCRDAAGRQGWVPDRNLRPLPG